jgi:putative membrane protein
MKSFPRKLILLAALACAAMVVPAGLALASGDHGQARHRHLSSQDREWLTSAIQGAKFEVLGGMTAVHHASSPAVKAFGKRMIRDHSREYRDLRAVAHRLGVPAPTRPDPEQRKSLWVLSHFWGGKFNCAYITDEYSDHVGDKAEAELEIAAGSNHVVKQNARQWLRVYEMHLSMASRILLSLNHC